MRGEGDQKGLVRLQNGSCNASRVSRKIVWLWGFKGRVAERYRWQVAMNVVSQGIKKDEGMG